MRGIKPPLGAPSWGRWLGFHVLVWRLAIRGCWVWAVLLPLYLTQLVFFAEELWVKAVVGVCVAVSAYGISGARARARMEVVTRVQRHVAWQQMQQQIRQAMLADGISPEDADQALWQMDMEVNPPPS